MINNHCWFSKRQADREDNQGRSRCYYIVNGETVRVTGVTPDASMKPWEYPNLGIGIYSHNLFPFKTDDGIILWSRKALRIEP